MDDEGVSLVIPGRNCTRTLRPCLQAAVSILTAAESPLREILFVDDASTDDTARGAAQFPVRVLQGIGGGPGSARNVGWRAATRPLIWFIDSDCVAEPEALALLLPHLADPQVAGVGGSYGNMNSDSLLACLIHEEIIERHRAMPAEVNFLGGFNVLYRRHVLDQVGGFDERHFNGPGSPGAEDAELSYRVLQAGHRLRFEPRSRVKHDHPTKLSRYLRTQRHHGYWRVNLHLRHRAQAGGDAYSTLLDHAQPPVAMAAVAMLPLLLWFRWQWLLAALLTLLLVMQVPMTLRLVRRLRWARCLWFAPLGMVRAFWRGAGMVQAIFLRP